MRFINPQTQQTVKFTNFDGEIVKDTVWPYRERIIVDIQEYGDYDKENYLIIPSSSYSRFADLFIANGGEYLED